MYQVEVMLFPCNQFGGQEVCVTVVVVVVVGGGGGGAVVVVVVVVSIIITIIMIILLAPISLGRMRKLLLFAH